MAKAPRSIFLLLFSLSVALGHLQHVPTYGEYLQMAAATIHHKLSGNSSSRVNFGSRMSQFYDAEGNNYLENMSPKRMAEKLSEDPSVMEKIHKLSQFDICGMIQSNVSVACCSKFESIVKAVMNKELWALQIIDSLGKPASGILQGNMVFTGSYDECLATAAVNKSGVKQFEPKYCQLNFPNGPSPFAMMGFTVKFGLCAPDICKPEELNYLFQTAIHLMKIPLINVDKTYVTCPEVPGYNAGAIVSITVCSIFLALLVFGTLYDIIYIQLELPQKFTSKRGLMAIPNITYTSQMSYDEAGGDDEKKPIIPPIKEDPGWFGQFLLCFSFYKNATKLLKTDIPEGSLTSLHGIRFLSMTWVVLGHTYVFGMSVYSNNKNSMELMSRFTFQAIGNATVSVDTFFMISGLLVVYGVLKMMEANDGKMNWVHFYVHRYWRLTPPYMLVMMVYVPLMQYWGDGPYWPQNGFEVNYCKDTWWYNLLYINNFNDKECMAWSWYLANDMQFYVISPIILIFLYRKPKIGFGIISILMLAQLITCGWIMKVKEYQGLLSPNFFTDVYVKPYTRIGSYLVGMIYGYILYKYKCKMVLNKFLVGLLWLFFTVCAIAVLYGLYDSYNGSPLSADVMAFYTTVYRIVWALCVGWVLYACVSGYGGFVNTILSWKAIIPLSRLTYCTYLVHPVVMMTFYLTNRYPIYLTDLGVIYLFFGHLGLAFIVAFVVSMAFESPMIGLEALIRGKKKK